MEHNNEPPKKVNLEDLPKEELLERCKNLLVIAQKAKQCKDKLQEENNKLREELCSNNTVQTELIESLTQQKLEFVKTIDELKNRNKTSENNLHSLEDKLNHLETENVSYKRQLTRTTTENEELLDNLDALEKQIEQLNQLGIEQREQLLALEKSNLEQCNVISENNKNATEIETHLKEIDRLKSENNSALNRIHELEKICQMKDENVLKLSGDLNSTNVKELQCKIESLSEINNLNQELIDKFNNQEDCILLKQRLENLNIELTTLKQELESKENTITTMKNKEETNITQLNQEIQLKQTTIDKLNCEIEEIKQYSTLQEDCTVLKQKIEELNTELTNFKDKGEANVKQLQLKQNTIDKLNSDIEEITKQYKTLQADCIIFKQNIEDLNTEVITLKQESLSKENTIVTLKNKEETNATQFNQEIHLKQTTLEEISKQYNTLQEEYNNQTTITIKLKDKLKIYHVKLVRFANDIKYLKQQKQEILDIFKTYTEQVEKWKNQLTTACNNLLILVTQLESDKDNLTKVNEQYIKEIEEYQITNNELNATCDAVKNNLIQMEERLNSSNKFEQLLAERSSEEIIKLVDENKQLNIAIEELQKEPNKLTISQESTNCNSELLREMNEMNQELKERGETISKLEAHCDEIKKKLQIYESQANKNIDSLTEKDEIIKNLTHDIEVLKERNNSNLDTSYADSEVMSTSTISRSEEANRLKELEGSWEERYVKLRNLAVKLKAKIRDQNTVISNNEKNREELHTKLQSSVKTIQSLQTQLDNLQDILDKTEKERKEYLNKLNDIATNISKDKQNLAQQEETIAQLNKTVEGLKKELQSTETWKKQVSAKVQTLRKEIEAKNLMKKEFENTISKLNTELEGKEKSLQAEIESHKQTKNLLDASNNTVKKNSVLNLEMQDYERGIKEMSQKFEKKKEEVDNLLTQLESYKSKVSALKEQNKILEDRVQNEETNANATLQEISTYKKKINTLENVLQEKDDKIHNITHQLENFRSENEEINTELSKVIAEHQKSLATMKSERDTLRNQHTGLQQNLRDIKDSIKLKSEEFDRVHREYESYKVRAQSVFRQSQNRDVTMEEKLLEQVGSLKMQNGVFENDLQEFRTRTDKLEADNENLRKENEDYMKKYEKLQCDLQELQTQYTQLSTKHQQTVAEHSETVRTLKVHADTLSKSYRQQISDQEVRHNRQIIELQSKLEKAPSPTESPAQIPPITLREEGEGSESVESNNNPQNLNNNSVVHPVPLERLLGSDLDQKIGHLKKQLTDQESKVVHLTALLSDTEQDLAKHAQMNKVLKEEIRRQQRSVEREKHAENLEYLKNVMFKFMTLSNGDERLRLVPVLNTILKLSPDESQKLNLVAKGEPGVKGWSNYLPSWSSPNK